MMTRLPLVVAAGVAAALLAAGPAVSARVPTQFARFWTIPPDDYRALPDAPAAFFPEAEELRNYGDDFGVAFSGGGTRSAAASLGELQGLRELGLLPRIRYASVVSGGAWGVLPWIFSPDRQLLGEYQPPESIALTAVSTSPNGSLAKTLTGFDLTKPATKEAAFGIWALLDKGFGESVQGVAEAARQELGQLTASGGRDRLDKTYTRLFAEKLIDPLIPAGSSSGFAWNATQLAEMSSVNRGRTKNVILEQLHRPFLITGTNIVYQRAGLAFPVVVPVEFTPMYIGARQQIGGVFGGLYAWPNAYDAVSVREVRSDLSATKKYLEVSDDPDRRLSLADVAATTGSAPLLTILSAHLPDSVAPLARKAAGVFPRFTHLAWHGGRVVAQPDSWPHGDGGFRDNLGLMPLLARHVHNIIVFVNVNSGDYRNNDDIRSMFFSVGPPDGGGDKRENVVFDEARWSELMDHFDQAAGADALVYCGQHWAVRANARFNVRRYGPEGVNICWVYPSKPSKWRGLLHEKTLQALVNGDDCGAPSCPRPYGNFSNFPWYSTAFENAEKTQPSTWHALLMTPAQINLLADVMAWSLVNPVSAAEITSKLAVTPNLPANAASE